MNCASTPSNGCYYPIEVAPVVVLTNGCERRHYHAHKIHKPRSLEEQQAFLCGYDFMVLVDKSRSMALEDEKGRTGWQETQEYLANIVQEAIKYDKHGIDACFFGSQTFWCKHVESEEKLVQTFDQMRPEGSANLADALQEAFNKHFKRKKENPDQKTILLVITEAAPDDKEKVENAIVACTQKINKKEIFHYHHHKKSLEIGIRFFHVGADQGAVAFLNELDGDLEKKGAKADIVDTGQVQELAGANLVREAFINALFE